MKVLIVSDTHGRNQNLIKVIKKVGTVDLLVHLGDSEGSIDNIEAIAACPVAMVAGNNDFYYNLPKEKIIEIGKYLALLTHGHRIGVRAGIDNLLAAAKINQVNIVMFGHTHIPMITFQEGIWLINPGSLTLPRQGNRKPSFIIMDIDNHGAAHFTLNYL
ncbi:MAG: metallophosphoesterase [Clostridiales bacterium]|nr:metallophosphoesterase [Clostridiales bacterium]